MQDKAALREAGEELGPQGDEASEVACALLAPLHKPKDPDMARTTHYSYYPIVSSFVWHVPLFYDEQCSLYYYCPILDT